MSPQDNNLVPTISRFTEMTQWLETPLGKSLLSSEAKLLDEVLPRRFGYHLLQLGCTNLSMFESSPIGHKFAISMDSSVVGHKLVANGEALPIANESVDLVLIHHGLDFSSNQHQLLREVSRVLIEGGDVVIIGFNLLSTWGLRRKLQWRKKAPWNGDFLSTRRLVDWLKLLEFQVETPKYGLYTLPFNSPAVIKYSSIFDTLATRLNWPTGGIYLISAKKQVLPLTPIKQPWRKLRDNKVKLSIPKNATSNSQIKLSKKD